MAKAPPKWLFFLICGLSLVFIVVESGLWDRIPELFRKC